MGYPIFLIPLLLISLRLEADVVSNDKIISQLSFRDKISLLSARSYQVSEPSIDAYGWYNIGNNGVYGNGTATVFPKSIGLAATWNVKLIEKVAEAISDEARAKYNVGNLYHSNYKGVSFWGPRAVIAYDPRWGGLRDSFGEDPFIVEQMVAAFIKSSRGRFPGVLKTASLLRYDFVAEDESDKREAYISSLDLYNSYQRPFWSVLSHTPPAGIVCSEQRINGAFDCLNSAFFEKARSDLGFDGLIATDYNSLHYIWKEDPVATEEEIVLLALDSGVALDNGEFFRKMLAFDPDIIEPQLTAPLNKVLDLRRKMGTLNKSKNNQFQYLDENYIHSNFNQILARKAARESIVLLKNKGDLLPLSSSIPKVAVIGPTSKSKTAFLGDVATNTGSTMTGHEAITRFMALSDVSHVRGVNIYGRGDFFGGVGSAVEAAEEADVAIVFLGPTNNFSRSEANLESVDLPYGQIDLLKRVVATGTPTILVITGGAGINLSWARENVDAILYAWYPGERGGEAIVDIILGKYNPSGKLPISLYGADSDLIETANYSMENRTYRYDDGPVVYPFGFGLSYSTFSCQIKNKIKGAFGEGDGITFTVTVSNTGVRDGEEVVQVFAAPQNPKYPQPRRQLLAFSKVFVKAGDEKNIELRVPVDRLQVADQKGVWRLPKGRIDLDICSQDAGTIEFE